MKLSEVRIPLHLAPLMAQLIKFKTLKNNGSGERMLVVPESWLAEVIMLAAEQGDLKMNQSEGKNEENEFSLDLTHKFHDNQIFNPDLPEAILELMKVPETNLIRAVMTHLGISLKDAAHAYGGASAQANLANFLARSNAELANMRPSTLTRLANAMGCPPGWLRVNVQQPGMFSENSFEKNQD